MKRIAYVMVNHNGGDEVIASVCSLMEDLEESDLIILVDNGSSDQSADLVVEKFPAVFLLKNDSNETFAGACNRGLRYALNKDFRYAGLINPDVRIEPGMTNILIEKLESDEVNGNGAVSPLMLYKDPPDRIWYAGGRIHWLLGWFSHRGQGKGLQKLDKHRGTTQYLTGCCWVAPASVWRTVGPLSEIYGIYTEDADWSWRAYLKGYSLIMEPSAVLVHSLSQSTGGKRSPFKLTYRTLSSRLFFRKFASRRQRFIQFFTRWSIAFLYSIFLALTGDSRSIPAYIRANAQSLGERVPWPPPSK